MSNSKFIMAQKLNKVQRKLMGETISDDSLESLLPLIFNSCCKENLTFWFNFLENACVLNLRDVEHENYELNIRYTYESAPISMETINEFKRIVLINTFLITPGSVNVGNVASSENKKTTDETPIISGDTPVPAHIRKAITTLQSKDIPVTKESITNHLPLGQMSTSARLECNKYLKQMEDSQ